MYLIYVLNIDILPDILNNDIPRVGNEESIKFSYFSPIQTEAIKQMVAGEGCCDGLCRMMSGRRAGGLMIFLGMLGCTVKILMGAGVVDGGSSERCFKWGGGVIEEFLLKQLKRGLRKGINCL